MRKIFKTSTTLSSRHATSSRRKENLATKESLSGNIVLQEKYSYFIHNIKAIKRRRIFDWPIEIKLVRSFLCIDGRVEATANLSGRRMRGDFRCFLRPIHRLHDESGERRRLLIPGRAHSSSSPVTSQSRQVHVTTMPQAALYSVSCCYSLLLLTTREALGYIFHMYFFGGWWGMAPTVSD